MMGIVVGMEFDAVTHVVAQALVIISLLGMMIRMNRSFADLTAKVDAIGVKVEAIAADLAEINMAIRLLRAEMKASRLAREEIGQRAARRPKSYTRVSSIAGQVEARRSGC